jgi:hypothetical protein
LRIHNFHALAEDHTMLISTHGPGFASTSSTQYFQINYLHRRHEYWTTSSGRQDDRIESRRNKVTPFSVYWKRTASFIHYNSLSMRHPILSPQRRSTDHKASASTNPAMTWDVRVVSPVSSGEHVGSALFASLSLTLIRDSERRLRRIY